jgi:hypothetical protein
MMTASWASRKPCLEHQEKPCILIQGQKVIELTYSELLKPVICAGNGVLELFKLQTITVCNRASETESKVLL